MRFAICNELFQDWPWERALDLTRECGYTGWEIAPFTLGGRPESLPAARREQLAQQVTRSGVEMLGLHWLLAKTEGYHLTTNDAAFRTFFSGSPVKRVGRNRFVRNVLYAIGNSGDQALLGSAMPLLDDADETVADAARWAVEKLS